MIRDGQPGRPRQHQPQPESHVRGNQRDDRREPHRPRQSETAHRRHQRVDGVGSRHQERRSEQAMTTLARTAGLGRQRGFPFLLGPPRAESPQRRAPHGTPRSARHGTRRSLPGRAGTRFRRDGGRVPRSGSEAPQASRHQGAQTRIVGRSRKRSVPPRNRNRRGGRRRGPFFLASIKSSSSPGSATWRSRLRIRWPREPDDQHEQNPARECK